MQTITLNLTVEEINLILEALGQQPFNQVYQLIGKIQSEASGQLQTAPSNHLSTDQTTVSANTEVNDHGQ